MEKLAALKKLLGLAEGHEEDIAENVSERTNAVDERQVEDAVDTATDAVDSKSE